MSTNITVPELGESIVEATIIRWFKSEGDPVKIADVLPELTIRVLPAGATGPHSCSTPTRRWSCTAISSRPTCWWTAPDR